MNATDIVLIISAITVAATSVIGAIVGAVVAIRTGHIKTTGEQIQATGEQTASQVNGHTAAMMKLLEKHRIALQRAGIPLPTDDSLKVSRERQADR